jgi:hypothetical protein
MGKLPNFVSFCAGSQRPQPAAGAVPARGGGAGCVGPGGVVRLAHAHRSPRTGD